MNNILGHVQSAQIGKRGKKKQKSPESSFKDKVRDIIAYWHLAGFHTTNAAAVAITVKYVLTIITLTALINQTPKTKKKN